MQRPGLLKIPSSAEGMGLGLESPAFFPMVRSGRPVSVRSPKTRVESTWPAGGAAARALTLRVARLARQLSPPAAHGDVLALFGGGALGSTKGVNDSSGNAAAGAGRFPAGDSQGDEEPDELAVRCATRRRRCAWLSAARGHALFVCALAGAGRPCRRLHVAQVRAEGGAGRGGASQLLQVQRGGLRRQEAGACAAASQGTPGGADPPASRPQVERDASGAVTAVRYEGAHRHGDGAERGGGDGGGGMVGPGDAGREGANERADLDMGRIPPSDDFQSRGYNFEKTMRKIARDHSFIGRLSKETGVAEDKLWRKSPAGGAGGGGAPGGPPTIPEGALGVVMPGPDGQPTIVPIDQIAGAGGDAAVSTDPLTNTEPELRAPPKTPAAEPAEQMETSVDTLPKQNPGLSRNRDQPFSR